MQKTKLMFSALLASTILLTGCGDIVDNLTGKDTTETNNIPVYLTVDNADKQFTGKMIDWGDNHTYSYLNEDKTLITVYKPYSDYSYAESYIEEDTMGGNWDAHDNNIDLIFSDGEIWYYNIDGTGGDDTYITLDHSDTGFYESDDILTITEAPENLVTAAKEIRQQQIEVTLNSLVEKVKTAEIDTSAADYDDLFLEKISASSFKITWVKRTENLSSGGYSRLVSVDDSGNVEKIVGDNFNGIHTLTCEPSYTSSYYTKFDCNGEGPSMLGGTMSISDTIKLYNNESLKLYGEYTLSFNRGEQIGSIGLDSSGNVIISQ